MKYIEAKSIISKFTKIVVSGPQRSGTTIAAKIIASDFKLNFIDEADRCRVGFDIKSMCQLIDTCDNFVVQCPVVCAKLHELPQLDNVLIIIMKRDINDIIASQKRIKWNCDDEEKNTIRIGNKENISLDFNQPVSSVKYEFWNKYQKSRIKHYIELDYESLSNHSLWIKKELRKGFTSKQTSL